MPDEDEYLLVVSQRLCLMRMIMTMTVNHMMVSPVRSNIPTNPTQGDGGEERRNRQ